MVLADPQLEPDTVYAPYRARAAALSRADSLIGEVFKMRAPEVVWVLPEALRRMARRSPGMLTDPDEMGQAMLRSSRLEQIPDQLAGALRKLVAVSNGRMVMVPAALSFSRAADGQLRADLALALVDTRRNAVIWRSIAVGHGGSPDQALASALTTIFPQ